jgi:zinc protease
VQAELRQAKALLLREIPLSESSVDEIAAGLLLRATEDLPLDEPTVAARRYVTLTARTGARRVHKMGAPHALVLVTQGPTPK